MRVGELVWKIEFSDAEKARIANLLAEEESEANDVFFRHSLKTRIFPLVARTLHRKIHGYRVNTPTYQTRARAIILKDLQKNRAPKKAWDIYQHSIASFVASELPALDELMREVEVDDNTEPNSRAILELIAKHSTAFEVDKDDIERIYELWPFERQDDVAGMLENCERFDRFVALEGRYRELRIQLHQLGEAVDEMSEAGSHHTEDLAELKEGVTSLVTRFELESNRQADLINNLRADTGSSDADRIDELAQQVADLTTSLAELATLRFSPLEESTARLNERIDRLRQDISSIPEQAVDEGRVTSHDESIKDLFERLEVITTQVGEIDTRGRSALADVIERQEQLTEDVHSRHAALETLIDEGAKNQLLHAEKVAPPDDIKRSLEDQGESLESNRIDEITDELELLKSFSTIVGSAENDNVLSSSLLCFHTLMKASPLLIVSDTSLVKKWISCMGWSHHTSSVVASPVWTRPDDWQAAFDSLSDSSNDPRLVIVYDYDLGLVESYLNPTLRLWREAAYGGYLRKLILVQSARNDSESHKLSEEAFVWLDQIEQLENIPTDKIDIKESIVDSPTTARHRVPPITLFQWCAVDDEATLAKTDEFISTISESLLSSSVLVPGHVVATTQRILAQLMAAGIDSKSSLKTVIDAVVMPWLQARHGRTVATEFQIYAETNLP